MSRVDQLQLVLGDLQQEKESVGVKRSVLLLIHHPVVAAAQTALVYVRLEPGFLGERPWSKDMKMCFLPGNALQGG